MKRTCIICLCLMASALLLAGCHKPAGETTVEVNEGNIVRSFTCPDSGWVNDAVRFLPDSFTRVVNTNTYLWSFGDGNTAADAYVAHAYATPGVYTVTMTVNSNKKTVAQRVLHILEYHGPWHMATMAAPRRWAGTNSINWGTSTPISDTSVAIQVVDSGKVMVNGALLTFQSMEAPKALITYSDRYRSSLTYYYVRDSMSFSYTWQSTVGHGGQMLYLHTW